MKERRAVLHPFEIPSFNKAQNPVKDHGDDAQDDNGHQNPGEFEGLAAIDDEISKPLSGADKFSDDHTHQAEAYVYFHHT